MKQTFESLRDPSRKNTPLTVGEMKELLSHPEIDDQHVLDFYDECGQSFNVVDTVERIYSSGNIEIGFSNIEIR